MPITGVIPQAKSGMDAFLEQMQRNKENQYREALGEQARANAERSKIMTQLLGGISSGAGIGGGSGSGQPQMDANKALMMAGILKMPTQVVEGNLITPFGSFPVGESPSQKGQREVGEAVQKKSGEKNVDISTTLNTEADNYLNAAKGYLKLHKLHKENPDLTGIKTGMSEKFKQPLKKGVGEYIGIANNIQADLARALSQRGGAAATTQAGRMKPNIWNPEGTNLGMISSNIDILNDKLETVNAEYRAIHGKNMPQYESFKEMYDEYKQNNSQNKNESPNPVSNGNFSPQNLINQAQASGEGIANVPAQQQAQTQNINVSQQQIKELAMRKGKSVPEIIMLLLKKGYKIEGMNNEQ
jgi:hypothetical protein